ncbi:MAG: hypothetical protein ACJ76H_08655 [Bacteriovoracaceae bacterium]
MKNLEAVRVIGEGKGRLHIREQQYLFGLESVLKENNDWIMAVTIPLHGEEALIFPKLNEKNAENLEMESFARRIDAGIQQNLKNSQLRGSDFIVALRKTVRFLLASRLKLPVTCKKTSCTLDDEEFLIAKGEKTLQITTKLPHHQLITTASNLTGPFFLHTQFKVTPNESKQDLLTLELFWQE